MYILNKIQGSIHVSILEISIHQPLSGVFPKVFHTAHMWMGRNLLYQVCLKKVYNYTQIIPSKSDNQYCQLYDVVSIFTRYLHVFVCDSRKLLTTIIITTTITIIITMTIMILICALQVYNHPTSYTVHHYKYVCDACAIYSTI